MPFDYILIGEQLNYGVTFTNTTIKAFFALCCNHSDDDSYIGLMFQMLSRNLDRINEYDIDDLKRQFFNQYKRKINWNQYVRD